MLSIAGLKPFGAVRACDVAVGHRGATLQLHALRQAPEALRLVAALLEELLGAHGIGHGLVGLEVLAAEAVGDAPADLDAGRGAAVLHLVLSGFETSS